MPEAWSWFGINILGTPVCNGQRLSEERIGKEEHLWRAIV